MHDLLYLYQAVWAPLKEPGPFFLSLADSAGISKPKLLECVKAGTTETEIRSRRRAPSGRAQQHADFYIEGGLLAGAQPLPRLPPGARLDLRREVQPLRANSEKRKGPLFAAPPGKCRLGSSCSYSAAAGDP